MGNTINIAGTEPESFTDGTGIRYTLFVQGCKHYCAECHNPETWKFGVGQDITIEEILSEMKENPLLDGITFSGGDPMYQAESCAALAKLIKETTQYNIWCYTGFTFDECLEDNIKAEFLKYIDVLVDGPYIKERRSLELPFRGSSNQRIINVQESLKTGSIVLVVL